MTGAKNALTAANTISDWTHISSLTLQCQILIAVNKFIKQAEINQWSKCIINLEDAAFRFVRKAIIQQLPTKSNLARWGKSLTNLCPLCNTLQTNKHVLSACSSSTALDRFTARHNAVLSKLLVWLCQALRVKH